MKFRFCGDLDAPDWILAEISVLSKFSSVRMKLLCRQVLEQLLGRSINWEKIQKLTTGQRLSFELGDIKAMIAALHFILASSAKYDCEERVLSVELQQLGLPKDICSAICRSYRTNKDKLREFFSNSILHLPQIQNVKWRVDYICHSSELKEVNTPTVRLMLETSKPAQITPGSLSASSQTINFEISAEKFRILYNELKAARMLMDDVS
eukprot:TRINITY_DN8318_c0_g1_i3.p1 TRINITY_DN8318_c0_g1~~TRINITY_DN8318_c0_g1_i3.p1  ORF type:complete len:209 (+),score=39.85 TRINITY_DN8318_c0_g1_i3:73-699(+)